MRKDNKEVKAKQIRKFCADNITRLDSQIYMGSLTKAQKQEAFEVIAQLREVMKSPTLIEQIAEKCKVQPRLVQIKMHNGDTRRKIHRYVYGIPDAMRAVGIFN